MCYFYALKMEERTLRTNSAGSRVQPVCRVSWRSNTAGFLTRTLSSIPTAQKRCTASIQKDARAAGRMTSTRSKRRTGSREDDVVKEQTARDRVQPVCRVSWKSNTAGFLTRTLSSIPTAQKRRTGSREDDVVEEQTARDRASNLCTD